MTVADVIAWHRAQAKNSLSIAGNWRDAAAKAEGQAPFRAMRFRECCSLALDQARFHLDMANAIDLTAAVELSA